MSIDLDALKALDRAGSPAEWEPVLLNDLSDVTYIEGTPLGHPAGKQAASFPDGKGGWTEGFADEALQEQIHADARLIATMRNALPALIEVAEAAQEIRRRVVFSALAPPIVSTDNGLRLFHEATARFVAALAPFKETT